MPKIIRSLVIAAAGLGLLVPWLGSAPADAATESRSRVATYNSKPHLANPEQRMRHSLGFLKEKNISVVAMQELGNRQARIIKDSPAWRQYRATSNGGNLGSGNAVVWRAGTWERIGAWEYTLQFKDPEKGKRPLHFPVVRLRNKANRVINVVSIHQPAKAINKAERTRLRGEHRQKIAALKKKYAHVIVMGDFNASKPVACGWTRQHFLLDASGYHDSSDPGCDSMPPAQRSIDRIFGKGRIEFTHYVKLTKPDDAGWSDHPVVAAWVRYW